MATGGQTKKRKSRRSVRRGPAHAIAETAKLIRPLASDANSAQLAQKLVLADWLKGKGIRFSHRNAGSDQRPAIPLGVKLSRRLRQTLDRLLIGDSEKQIATNLQVSPHTVHVYVKSLYRQFEVNSRGELPARFIHNPSGLDQ